MSLKCGLIARAEDRGLGVLTWEFARGMNPDRVLVVDMGALGGGYVAHLDRYPGATVAPFDGHRLDEAQVRAWLDGLDVVYSAETFYDWRVIDWAREAGVATVCHAMPEFYRHDRQPELPHPTAWWNPTTWRMEHMPPGTRHVPVPVALDRFPLPGAFSADDEPLRVLHVVGRPALGDRNGSQLLAMALRLSRERIHVEIITQARRFPHMNVNRSVTVNVTLGGTANYWDLYRGHDVLAMPRRFGGLCLPAQEAMASGLAVVMPEIPPNTTDWPVLTVPGAPSHSLEMPCGDVQLTNVHPSALARQLDTLAADRTLCDLAGARGRLWASSHSWDALRPLYTDELAAAADRT